MLIKRFEISDPVRSVINLYKDERDKVGFHKDYYTNGINFTVGVSMGATRRLEFVAEEDFMKNRDVNTSNMQGLFSFPQGNGDIFAFSDFVNNNYRHGVPMEREKVGENRCE